METFGTDDIRRAIGAASFSRGQDYFECGMVQSVEFETPCRIHGRVSGSRSNVYSVSAILTFEANAMPGRVADRENSALAGHLIEETCHKQGVQPQVLTLHSDSERR